MAEHGRLYPLAKAILTPSTMFLFPTRVTGLQNVCRTGPAIIAPNHISFFDSVVLIGVLPRRITCVGKAEYLDSWKTRYVLPAMGMIPIERTDRRQRVIHRRGRRFGARRSMRGPRVSFNRPVTPHRRVGFASVPFADVHDIKQASGTTVHDVVMAICAGGVRRWLSARDELPAEPLLAAVPVLVRADADDLADQVSMMIAPLPTNEADPRRRLASAHEAMRIAKERHDAVPANLIQDMTRYAPPAVAGLAARLVGAIPIDEMASPPFNLTISNVPGPRHAVYCAGHRLVANYPLSVISAGVGLHIALVTYDDMLHLGVVTCRDALPSQWELVDDIVASFHELRAAVVDAAPPHRRDR